MASTQAFLVKIRDLVLRDPVALDKWTLIVDHLVNLASDAVAIKNRLAQDSNFGEAVLQTLQIRNANGDGLHADLLAVLEMYELNSLAEQIRLLAPLDRENPRNDPRDHIPIPGPSSIGSNGENNTSPVHESSRLEDPTDRPGFAGSDDTSSADILIRFKIKNSTWRLMGLAAVEAVAGMALMPAGPLGAYLMAESITDIKTAFSDDPSKIMVYQI